MAAVIFWIVLAVVLAGILTLAVRYDRRRRNSPGYITGTAHDSAFPTRPVGNDGIPGGGGGG